MNDRTPLVIEPQRLLTYRTSSRTHTAFDLVERDTAFG